MHAWLELKKYHTCQFWSLIDCRPTTLAFLLKQYLCATLHYACESFISRPT